MPGRKNRGRSAVEASEMEGIAHVDARARSGRESFAASVDLHYPALVRRLTSVLRDPETALDLAQETYLRAYRAWDRFDGTDVRAWLYTIGLRLAFNERERRARWAGLPRRGGTESAWVHRDDLALHDALGRLGRDQRAALLLSAVDGYTQAEIAGMLGVPPGTVASWLSRAKAQLREELRP
jgi:RNA polymerase sigma-70 factor (ECF subfamily)